jgi:hypothetical protein
MEEDCMMDGNFGNKLAQSMKSWNLKLHHVGFV